MIKSRYVFTKRDHETADALSRALKLPKAVALLLVRQGIGTEAEARTFFSPTFSDLHDPYLMKNMRESVLKIQEAVKAGKKIAVFCDYDVDGTSALSILYLYFKKIGVVIDYYTPDRNNDGYGLNASAVKEIVDAGTDLVITVDCGITNVAETAMLTDAGVAVIVTDHHECGEVLPNTPYILNPKQPECHYPYQYLSGAGIAFKLVQALGGRDAMDVADYAALGTVADIVPLTGENRVIAKLGLAKMNTSLSPGLKLLRPFVLPDNKSIDEYHIGFGFGPRINAAGRMESAHLALNMMLAEKETADAKRAAARLNTLNEQRKDICDGIVMDAMAQVIKENMLASIGAIFVIGDWEPGVVGICASRIAARFGRPVLAFAKKGDEAVCSARSIDGINIYDVLNNFNEYYTKFGGHHMAAGLTIKFRDYDTLKTKVNAHLAQQYSEDVFVPAITYDIEVQGDLTDSFAEAVTRLAPYGTENPKPRLLFRDRAVRQKNYFGKASRSHFKFNLNESGKPLSAIKFYYDQKDDAIARADVVGSVNISDYMGRPEIFIDDMESTDLDEYLPMPAFAYECALLNLTAMVNEAESSLAAVDLNEWVVYIEEKTKQSPFGTAVLIEDIFQYQLLATHSKIKEMVARGSLLIKMANEYHVPLNAVVFSEKHALTLKPYREIIGFSFAPQQSKESRTKRFIVKELLDMMRDKGRRFYVGKDEMALVFVWLKACAKNGRRPADREKLYADMAKETGLNIEQAVSGVAVLESLQLIELEKSDSIVVKIIAISEKKDLRDAAAFAALQRLK